MSGEGRVRRHMVRSVGEGWECVDCGQKFPVWPPDSEPCFTTRKGPTVRTTSPEKEEELCPACGERHDLGDMSTWRGARIIVCPNVPETPGLYVFSRRNEGQGVAGGDN